MPALREPQLGPIVGHVSDTTCRIWIRAGNAEEPGAEIRADRRSIGVIALVELAKKYQASPPGDPEIAAVRAEMRKKPDKVDAEVYYFRLHRQYDRTGTFCHGTDRCLKHSEDFPDGKPSQPLKPGTRYLALVGTLFIDDPYADDINVSSDRLSGRLPDPNVWRQDLIALPDDCTASFRTYAAADAGAGEGMSFILGSCRYPGMLWKIKEADMIFGPLRAEALGAGARAAEDAGLKVAADPVDFVLMVGDQIYADMYNRHVPIGLADTFEEFQERYHTAFGSHNMRKLLRQVPHYMILDDHEIEDNWAQDRLKKAASRKVFHLAVGAYMSYQWSHCPRSFGTRLYYNYECAGYPFFVLDTRTQRFMDDVVNSLDDNHLLGRPTLSSEEPGQLARLLRWLVEQQTTRGDAPKFIVTSSVFVPNPIDAREGREGTAAQKVKWKEGSDSWPAFPNTRRAVLGCILKNRVQNVVFLSGDIHCANVAAIDFSGSAEAEAIKAFAITSSAFYWPFSFADGEPSGYVHDSRVEGQEDSFDIDGTHRMDYRSWHFTQEDNFSRVDLDPKTHRLRVAVFNKEGGIVRKNNWLGRPTGEPLVTDLQLAPW